MTSSTVISGFDKLISFCLIKYVTKTMAEVTGTQRNKIETD